MRYTRNIKIVGITSLICAISVYKIPTKVEGCSFRFNSRETSESVAIEITAINVIARSGVANIRLSLLLLLFLRVSIHFVAFPYSARSWRLQRLHRKERRSRKGEPDSEISNSSPPVFKCIASGKKRGWILSRRWLYPSTIPRVNVANRTSFAIYTYDVEVRERHHFTNWFGI